MTRDDLITMARQAGFQTGVIHAADGSPAFQLVQAIGTGCIVELEHFAALVSAAEREACAKDAEAFHCHGYDFTGNLELHEWLRSRPTGHKES